MEGAPALVLEIESRLVLLQPRLDLCEQRQRKTSHHDGHLVVARHEGPIIVLPRVPRRVVVRIEENFPKILRFVSRAIASNEFVRRSPASSFTRRFS